MPSTSPVLIAFGSNIDPLPNLHRGLLRLHQEVGISAVSTVYRTAALPDPERGGSAAAPDFLNGAVRLESQQDPFALQRLLRTIEAELQRVRTAWRYAPRTLDLDIALMGESLLQSEQLVLPDPDILQRPFLAIPLAELAPDLLHPLEGCSLSEIASRFADLTADAEATTLLQSLSEAGLAGER
ncbi:MAG: 2-amino-4-hydroxy-6-hydroxymethyldihydropteridine diphosphokinase [Magnetococcales bacterium]|nr:2-amino-4-hydroxy-6-hydroxymethyldihydropteridine diphosphokinase [Magnetococcales bacterium]